MAPQNIIETYHLSAQIRHGFAPMLPFHPYALIAVDQYQATPKIIISYDRNTAGRFVNEVPRVKGICTHVNIGIIGKSVWLETA